MNSTKILNKNYLNDEHCRLNMTKNFFNTHFGYPWNFIFAIHHYVTGAYLWLEEVKCVKTGVPEVKPLLGGKWIWFVYLLIVC